MADTKLKNITRVDVLEQSSGVEKVLVETEDTLKKLPIDQIKGSGGGAGFDVMGNLETVFIPNSGELIVMDPIEMELDPQSEPGFNDFFGQGPFDTNNFYQRFVNITNLGMEATLYGYFYSPGDEWAYTMDVSDLLEYGEMGYRVSAICPYTYAELLEAQRSRPITGILNYSASETVYLQTIGSFPGAMAKAQFAEILPSEILEAESIIFLLLGRMDNLSNVFGYLVLYEAGTTSEPVLGTCFIVDDD